ncbi:MAG: hypothetical protein V3S14_15965 [Anaerolineae bacterium]
MFRSLNFRLLLSYVVVILVCLTLVGLGLFLFVRSSPLWTSAAFLRLEAAARATIPTLLRANTAERFEDLLTQAAEEQEVRMLLLNDRGVVRFDHRAAATGSRCGGGHRQGRDQHARAGLWPRRGAGVGPFVQHDG